MSEEVQLDIVVEDAPVEEAPKTALTAVSELIPYFNNPRIHSDDAIASMIESIRSFGFRIPVLVKYSEDGPEVIDGHLRLKAAIEMGLEQVPTIDASDMSDEQVQAFRLMVNQSSNWAAWDETKLFAEIKAIRDSELAGMSSLEALTGFGAGELSVFEGFQPDKLPEVDIGSFGAVDAGQLDAAQSQLEGQFEKKDEMFEVVCPECANTFHIKK